MAELLKIVKPFGKGGAHIILPIKYLGKNVKVEIIKEPIKIEIKKVR